MYPSRTAADRSRGRTFTVSNTIGSRVDVSRRLAGRRSGGGRRVGGVRRSWWGSVFSGGSLTRRCRRRGPSPATAPRPTGARGGGALKGDAICTSGPLDAARCGGGGAISAAAGVGARPGAFAAAAGVGARPTPLPATAASFDAELGIGVDLPRSSFGTEKPWRRSGDGAGAFRLRAGHAPRDRAAARRAGRAVGAEGEAAAGESETRSDIGFSTFCILRISNSISRPSWRSRERMSCMCCLWSRRSSRRAP